ncbi:hypothetical protein [Streptomyces bauhiniae]|uniref:hypothetical protein n=1 Tax=Streptomyces bauhiniae TaxID=2340725 RepID=UPI003F4BA9F3
MNLIGLQGLILLVNACTKPACAPFKQWVAEVIETVQREGFYALEEAEVQPAAPGAPVAYAYRSRSRRPSSGWRRTT